MSYSERPHSPYYPTTAPPAYAYVTSHQPIASSSSSSSPRSSVTGANAGRSETIIQVNGQAGIHSSTGSSVEDSEGYESEVASSTSRRLRLGKVGTEGEGLLSSRSSRASSPTPGAQPSVQHFHHHIHYHGGGGHQLTPSGSRSSTGSLLTHWPSSKEVVETDLENDLCSDDEGDDEFSSATASSSSARIDGPIFHYATLARKLGLYGRDNQSKIRTKQAKQKKRDSIREKAWFRNNKQRRRSRSGPIALSTSSQSSEEDDDLQFSSPFARCVWSAVRTVLRQPCVPSTPVTLLFALVLFASFAFSLTTFIIHVLDTDKEPLPWRSFCQDQRPFPHDLANNLPPVDLFVGVFSVDSAYERRHLIRTTYARHTRPLDPTTGRPADNVQLKFIIGRPRTRHARRVALEMELYGDVVVLDVQENMNRGKTYAFFKWAVENATVPVYFSNQQDLQGGATNGISEVSVGFKRADYVVKADDDSFLFLNEIERHLRITPREKTYWGYLIRQLFMGGEVYALSADLVDYVASYAPLAGHVNGAEDKKVARWMRMHPNASSINWVTERCWIYDHPKAGTTYAHGFLFPDEVERIRAEGRRGLTDSERERRGGATWAQTWSSVSEWRKDYMAPAGGLSIEEETEALIEGGGRWRADRGWMAPNDLVDSRLVRFDVDDERLQSTQVSSPRRVVKPKIDWSEVTEPPIAYRYNKIANDLLADPDKLVLPTRGITANLSDEALSPYVQGEMPKQYHATLPVGSPLQPSRVPVPTLRYDQAALSVRNERMLGLPYGGTVAVHFLKRNEWFLETAVVLLGRSAMWEGGAEPAAFISPLLSVNSEVDLPRMASARPAWNGEGSVQVMGPHWGGARMWGSPILRPDGGKDVYISEGRPVPVSAAAKKPAKSPLAKSPLLPPQNDVPPAMLHPPNLAYADPVDGPSFGLPVSSEVQTTSEETTETVAAPDEAAPLDQVEPIATEEMTSSQNSAAVQTMNSLETR